MTWFARPLHRRSSQRHQAPPHERGAALVELSIVALILTSIAAGTLEIGLAWSDAQLVTQAARSGARVAAQVGDDPNADQYILDAVEAALGDLAGEPAQIKIYNAEAADGAMHVSCETASHPGNTRCSIYDESHFVTFAQGSWNPSARDSTIAQGAYIGIEITVDRPLATQFLGTGTMAISETAVMRIEVS